MRIEPGAHRHTASNGWELSCAVELPASTVEHLVRQMIAQDLCPCVVLAVEFHGEAPPTFDVLPREHIRRSDGVPYCVCSPPGAWAA